jgi:NADPH2:quinone reductase
MKAAVLHELGAIPRYEDFPPPVAGDGKVVVDVKAVAVENVDKAVAAGTHFTTGQFLPQLPAVVGFDGIGTLPDGTMVGFGLPRPPYGALAERTVVPVANTIPAPEGIDPAIAVVLSSAVTGLAIKTAAGFAPGETVLVQGATGVAGRLAVQVARLLGAGRVVATGRDDGALREVVGLGADTVINTAVPDSTGPPTTFTSSSTSACFSQNWLRRGPWSRKRGPRSTPPSPGGRRSAPRIAAPPR